MQLVAESDGPWFGLLPGNRDCYGSLFRRSVLFHAMTRRAFRGRRLLVVAAVTTAGPFYSELSVLRAGPVARQTAEFLVAAVRKTVARSLWRNGLDCR
jgi:hypothetical protein